jgi:hypothetical protein
MRAPAVAAASSRAVLAGEINATTHGRREQARASSTLAAAHVRRGARPSRRRRGYTPGELELVVAAAELVVAAADVQR